MRKLRILMIAALLFLVPAMISTVVHTGPIHQVAQSLNIVANALAQSDAGFLDPPGIVGWACLHSDGSFWAWTPFIDSDGDPTVDTDGYPDGQSVYQFPYTVAVHWCATHGYTY